MSWITPQQAESLTPDSGTLNRARKIAKSNKYQDVGASERAIWGVALGSSNYNSYVDLQGPAFKCSCPVKKLPCKHIMGLMLLVANDPDTVCSNDHPEALQEWLNKRDSTAQAKATKAEKKASGDSETDTATKAKRAEQREARVQQGINELRLFLEDTVSIGLLESSKLSSKTWLQIQKRLLDAQAKGLANIVEDIRLQLGIGSDWTDKVLSRIGELYRLIQAWENRDKLTPDQQDDIRLRIGWTKNREDVMTGPLIEGQWLTISQELRYDSGLHTLESWLIHQESGQLAQQLSYASEQNTSALKRGLVLGQLIKGKAAWYSQWSKQRAEFEFDNLFDQKSLDDFDWISAFAHKTLISACVEVQNKRLRTPWPDHWPMLVQDARLVIQHDRLALADSEKTTLPLVTDTTPDSHLLAMMGNQTCTVFGLTQDGIHVRPLSCFVNQRWQSLVPGEGI
jgi:hypothetical protein